MCMARFRDIVIDCHHPAPLARFWAAAMDGYAVAPYPAEELARLRSMGVFDPEDDPQVMVEGPPGSPSFFFQKVSESKAVKNRMHVDLVGDGAELERLLSRGAWVVARHPDLVVLADPEVPVADLMTTEVVTASVDEDQETVSRRLQDHDLYAIPVLDREERVVGIVTVDDAMDVLRDENTEDVSLIGGSSPLDRPYVAAGVLSLFRARVPWLLVLFIAESFTGEVLRNWDAIKATEPGREPGIFGEVPENLPGPLYARKVQRRAASSGFDFDHVPYDTVEAELEELKAAGDREAAFHEIGDVLFAAVNVARKLKVDPELALRAAAERFVALGTVAPRLFLKDFS